MTDPNGDRGGGAPTANETERRRWNDGYWASVWPRREALTDQVTSDLLKELHAGNGERLLDIGCGGGKVAIALGALVGPTGRVMGADISEPLITLARSRASASDVTNLDFVAADVQEDPIPGAPFSAAVSQFGVMFFDEPIVAFGNIRRHVEDHGRLVFACWQTMDRNPWALGHAIEPYAPPPRLVAPGKSATGPFAMGDFQRTAEFLRAAGWEDLQAASHERIVSVDPGAIFDDGQLAFNGVTAENLPAARDAVDRHLARFARLDGRLDVPIAYFIVSARAGRRSGVGSPSAEGGSRIPV